MTLRPQRCTRTDTLLPYTTRFRSHRRYPLRLLGARHIGQPGKILGEHLLVKKQNRGQRKILRVRRNVSIRRQTRKESLGLSTPKQRWVPFAVKDRKSTRLNSSH